jgi:signal transduction histidine kinase/ligand-binding sensor domain-containing protein/CheY-like chemotaxis protein/AraC-like DNA-binding protein
MLFWLAFSCNSLAAIDRFNYFGEQNGLSDLSVRSITQDHTGYLWVGTKSGVYKFNGHVFKKENILKEPKNLMVNSLFVDRQNNIWVGTQRNGLFRKQNNNWSNIELLSSNYNKLSITTIIEKNNKIWIATNKGLNFVNLHDNTLTSIDSLKGKHICSLEFISEDELLIGSKEELITYNIKLNKVESYQLPLDENTYVTHTLLVSNKVWVATTTGLLYFNITNKQFSLGPIELQNTRVLNILKEKDNIWIASTEKGLFFFEKGNNFRNITYSRSDNSLSDKYLKTMYISNNNLWVGNFFNGLNHLDLNRMEFKYEGTYENSIYCAETAATYNIWLGSKGMVWLSSTDGLIQFNKYSGECHLYNDSKIPFVVYSTTNKKQKTWLSTSQGLKQFDEKQQAITHLNFNGVVYFTFSDVNGKDYLATNAGLYEYNALTSKSQLVENTKNIEIKGHKKDKNGKVYLITSQGMAYLENSQLHYLVINDALGNSLNISSFHLAANNELYLATDDQRLIHYKQDGVYIESFSLQNEFIKSFKVYSIISGVDENDIWLGTDKGLIRYNLKSNQINVFKNIAGNRTNLYLPNSIYKSKEQELYFGTTTGFVYFNPNDIVLNNTPPPVVIDNMKLLNKDVKIGHQYASGFILSDAINNLDEIVIGYLDYIIGFEFSALDYANPSENQLRYKLIGFEEEWVLVDADHNQVTYSNLRPGNYSFEVKALNSYGIWNKQGKSLKIKVLPAPWLTWWAYTLYVCAFIFVLYWYLQRKNRENIRMTNNLRIQVKERTSELEIQKRTVEDLLAKKNEMFANVSHEFRTPLTLILGPIHKLMNAKLHSEDIQSLKMVNRNANRLLTMIEQLLLLAKITGEEKVQHIPQLIHHQILSIIEIFQPVALEKNIQLKLINNNKATIDAVPNTIDTVLGNLISNAIKYTPSGGEVSVNSFTRDEQIFIEVKDTGCGLDQKQKLNIFNRFERLDSHANIDGVGLGLSVVEEMIKINNGRIEIESELGCGSLFRVIFHTVSGDNIEPNKKEKYRLVNQLAKNVSLELTNKQTMINTVGQKSNNTILIIEDNDDMRLHISNCLKSHFHCLLADRGKAGIALAIKHVPDIIICDFMMPEMDGFKVSRVLRTDSRTSHIPLILLTALHDKESRIKGWREHVDAYLTKPFDAQELLLQLDNVLIIRNILKKKAGALITAGKKTSKNTFLCKKDQDFVNKLNAIIAKKYINPNYQRTQFASDMAMSEKQLQRKLKALIDKNPMEFLREYRLQKAAEMLKDGFQVSITCDDCGFNSLSHFSQCFKANYGISPKKYQQTCDSKN